MKTSSWLSKSIKITAVLALATAAIGFVNSAKAVEFGYSSTPGSSIHFDGASHFNFQPAVNNFQVDSGSCAGCFGEIGGTFTIGTITSVPTMFGVLSNAPVTGVGTFTIHDGAGFDLTASLTWENITQISSFGFLNVTGVANLTNITYGGTNPDLVALFNQQPGQNVLDFSFIPAVDLSVLKNGPGAHSTTFSGVITAPDGGATVMLLGAALGVLGIARRALKR